MLRANHQLVKFSQDGCQSLFDIICDNPTKVDATGHHHNVISKALSFQSLAPATYKSGACHAVFYLPTSRVWFVWACQCNAHATQCMSSAHKAMIGAVIIKVYCFVVVNQSIEIFDYPKLNCVRTTKCFVCLFLFFVFFLLSDALTTRSVEFLFTSSSMV